MNSLKSTQQIASKSSQLKSRCLLALSLSLMLITQTAHADFRKALEAYQKRDGATMLKEVKDAVDKRNDDGLLILLTAINFDAVTSARSDLYKYQDKKSTLKTILTDAQQLKMFNLIEVASKSAGTDQYLLSPETFIQNETAVKQLKANRLSVEQYAKQGSRAALGQMSGLQAYSQEKLYKETGKTNFIEPQNDWRLKLAEAGDAFTQFRLGLQYHHFSDGTYGCDDLTPVDVCIKQKDSTKGDYWLKRATKSFEESGRDGVGGIYLYGIYASAMGNFFQQHANGNLAQLKQAYLWCLFSLNSGSNEAYSTLNRMHTSGELKFIEPALDAVWDDVEKRHAMLSLSNLTELPNWIIEARKALSKQKMPVFSYFFNDYLYYQLDVYADGRVTINADAILPPTDTISANKYLYMRVPPQKVRAFLVELKKIGGYDWSLPLGDIYKGMDGNSTAQNYQLTLRSGEKVRRVYFNDYTVRSLTELPNLTTTRIAKINMLIEKHFPTQRLRCEIGNSEEYKYACIERDNQWFNLAKMEN